MGMFQEIGVTVKPGDTAMLRLLDVPDLLKVWKERRDKFLQDAAPAAATRAEIQAWRSTAEKKLARAFSGVAVAVGKARLLEYQALSQQIMKVAR